MTTATLMRPGPVLAAALAAFVVTAALVLMQLAGQGHAAYNTTSAGVMWGLPIVTYDFFLLTSTGLMMLASLWTVFGLKAFEPIARRALWLALAAIVGGVAALFAELGYPLRALYAIPFSFQVAAPLFWKVLGIIVYVVCLLVMIAGWVIRPAGAPAPRAVAVVGLFAAAFVTVTAAMVFGTMSMRPVWFGGDLAVVFLLESFLGATAFAIFFSYFAHGLSASGMSAATRQALAGPMSQLLFGLIVLHLVFVVGRVVAGVYANADGLQVWSVIARSPLFYAEILAGLVLPLLLLGTAAGRAKPSNQILAALLVALALFVGRYTFIIAGQLVPTFKGTWVHGLISYTPSATEWLVLAMAVFIANAISAFGEGRFEFSRGN